MRKALQRDLQVIAEINDRDDGENFICDEEPLKNTMCSGLCTVMATTPSLSETAWTTTNLRLCGNLDGQMCG